MPPPLRLGLDHAPGDELVQGLRLELVGLLPHLRELGGDQGVDLGLRDGLAEHDGQRVRGRRRGRGHLGRARGAARSRSGTTTKRRLIHPPGRGLVEGEAGAAHDALGIDLPLLVVQHLAHHRGRDAQEGVEGRGSAPVEGVAPEGDARPEAGGVARLKALETGAVALLDLAQDALAGPGPQAIAVAAPEVGHVHAQHEEDVLPRAERAQGGEEPRHPQVVLGLPSFRREGSAQHGHDARVLAQDVLEEHDLELDRVLDRVAVVLLHDRPPGGLRQGVHEGDVRGGLAEGRPVRLARQAEAVGRAVVGGPQHDHRAVPALGREPTIGRAVRVPGSFRARVGGGDAHEAPAPVHAAGGRPGFGGRGRARRRGARAAARAARGVGRIGAAGVGRLPPRRAGERRVLLLAAKREALVLEEARARQRGGEVGGQGLRLLPRPSRPQGRLERVRLVLAVEEAQEGHERRRAHEHPLRVAEGVANEQPGVCLVRRRQEVQAPAERWQSAHPPMVPARRGPVA